MDAYPHTSPGSPPATCCILYSRFLQPNFSIGAGTIEFSGVRVVFSDIGFVTPTGGTVVSRGSFEAVGGQFSIGSAAAVPEPAAWLMLVSGFGLAGTAVRRRVRTQAVVA